MRRINGVRGVTLQDTEIGQAYSQGSSTGRPYRVSVVIPARNEARNIAWVLENMPLGVDEIVLVDGHSSDRTIEVALAIRPDTVVVVDDAPGKGCAIRKGIETATGEFVVMLDADGSMDPQEIGRFVEPLREGYELVRGSRFMPGAGTTDMSPLRHAGNRAFLLLTRLLFGVKRSDLCYGYAAFRRSSINALGLTAAGFEIEAQLFLRAERAGLAVTEVPSFEAPRHAGTSNLHPFRDGWRVLRTILAERLRSQERLGAAVQEPAGAHAAIAVGAGADEGPIALAVGQSFEWSDGTRPSPPRRDRRLRRARTAVWPAARRQARLSATRTPNERAITAALVWSLAVKNCDHRLRAIALADYREARRHAKTPLEVPYSSRILEVQRELASARA